MPLRLKKQLIDILIKKEIIIEEKLNEALEVQKERGGTLGNVLVSLGLIEQHEFLAILSQEYGFPYLPLSNYEMDEAMMRLIPENVARQYCLIPIDKIGDTVTIAMADPLNTQAIEDIELVTGSSIQIFVSTATDIKKAIDEYYEKIKEEE